MIWKVRMVVHMVYKNVVDVNEFLFGLFFNPNDRVFLSFRMLMESMQLGTRQTINPIENVLLEEKIIGFQFPSLQFECLLFDDHMK